MAQESELPIVAADPPAPLPVARVVHSSHVLKDGVPTCIIR